MLLMTILFWIVGVVLGLYALIIISLWAAGYYFLGNDKPQDQ